MSFDHSLTSKDFHSLFFFIFHAHRTRINIMNQGNSERTPWHVGPTTIFRSHPVLLENHVNLTSTIQLSSSNYFFEDTIGHFPHKYLSELRGWGLWLPEGLWSRATWCFFIFPRVFFIVEKNVALFLIGIIFSRLVIFVVQLLAAKSGRCCGGTCKCGSSNTWASVGRVVGRLTSAEQETWNSWRLLSICFFT